MQRSVCYTLVTVKGNKKLLEKNFKNLKICKEVAKIILIYCSHSQGKSRGAKPSDNDGRGLSCEVAAGDVTDQTSRSYTRISAEQRGWTGKHKAATRCTRFRLWKHLWIGKLHQRRNQKVSSSKKFFKTFFKNLKICKELAKITLI